jgi:hypothetical protein
VLRDKGLVVVAAALVAAVAAARGTGAPPSQSLTVQVAPGTISGGQPALAVATFTNNRAFVLKKVVVTFSFPVSVAVTAPGCTPASGPASTVACSLGQVGIGGTAKAVVTFVAPGSAGSFQVGGHAAWGAGADFVNAQSQVAQIFAATDPTHVGTCTTGAGNLDAELNGQGTELTRLPAADPSLGLPCTPVAVGVEPRPSTVGFGTDIAIVDIPRLREPATVDLTFRDGELPGTPANPNQLREIPDPTNLNPATFFVVPRCQSGNVIPAGFDSCVVGVFPQDPDGDADAGIITLRVQGTGLGDPRYVG